MDSMQFRETAGAVVEKAVQGPCDQFSPKGRFHVEHWRDGVMLEKQEFPNLVTNVGKNSLLDVYFNAGSAISTWLCGLVDNAGWTAFVASDTMASHAGFVELQAYNEAVRQTWITGAASGQAVTNSTAMTFTMNASNSVKGIFITSVNTKGGATGTLFSEAAFASVIPVSNLDLLRITYTVSC